jgi:carbonic anhydrase/acetyltransferase-like protein (isoleucine patch superfamily)
MSTLPEYRPIEEKEIKVLLSRGCTCDNWSIIETKSGFDPVTCRNVRFSGKVKLGLFRKSITDESGVVFNSGINNATIHNCTIGDDVIIQNVGDYIANYEIGNNVIIRNCGRIGNEGVSSFGNGTLVSVLSETGARAVRIWDKLSAHQAYIVAMYRHRPEAVKILDRLSLEYSVSVSSDTGHIGENVTILNCSEIRNLKIGSFTRIDGALKLNDGSVNSCREDPVFIGQGVIMEHFIICSGSSVSGSTLADKCFIGQSCVLSKHFSIENSLLFANCSGFHGEACSVFAGPFTVTHHKSTLLIAAMFSFMNAGSGSNQSNHMYKLGPVHQGIVERGSKTTSNSYIAWPAHIGPFTLIMGRHTKNIDSSSLPFSYLIENKEESVIVPGYNLRSIGTMRDAEKWPRRDERKDPRKLDQINFDILSPYTVSKMIKGREILKKLKKEKEPVSGYYLLDNMKLDSHSLERGILLYQTGIEKFLGKCLINKLAGKEFNTLDGLRSALAADNARGKGEWIDLAGLIAPASEIDQLLDNIEKGKLTSIEDLSSCFEEFQSSYHEWAWTWAAGIIEKEEGKAIRLFNVPDVTGIIEKWKRSVVFLDNLLLEDAGKEFSLSSMTGFGVDGSEKDKQIDFEQVRGDYQTNRIVIKIHDHIKTKTALGEELIEKMNKISASG